MASSGIVVVMNQILFSTNILASYSYKKKKIKGLLRCILFCSDDMMFSFCLV